jgi:prepilin peptidase CpaA
MSEWTTGLVIVTVALVSGWYDVRERRIPNALTVSALAAALLIAVSAGLPSLGASLLGGGLCLLLAYPLFRMRGLGGGDVKLMVAFGALLGPPRLFPAMIVMAFVGGALGLVAMIRGGAVRRTFVNLYLMWQTVRNKIFARGERDEDGFWVTLDTPGAITVPYGIAISAGALYAWFF